MKLDEVLKIAYIKNEDEDGDQEMQDSEFVLEENKFIETVWESIKEASNQNEIYEKLMTFLVAYSQENPETKLINDNDKIKLLKDLEIFGEIDINVAFEEKQKNKEGKQIDKQINLWTKFSKNIQLNINKEKAEKAMLDQMRSIWCAMLNIDKLDIEKTALDYDETKNAMQAKAIELKVQFQKVTGFDDVFDITDTCWTIKEVLNYIIDGTPLLYDEAIENGFELDEDDKDKLKIQRKDLLQRWCDTSEYYKYNEYNNGTENGGKINIKSLAKCLGKESLELIKKTSFKKKKNKPFRYEIVKYYIKNFSLISGESDDKDKHKEILKKVLEHPSFTYKNKKIKNNKILSSAVLPFVNKHREALNLHLWDRLVKMDFKYSSKEHDQWMQSLIDQTEALIDRLEFTLVPNEFKELKKKYPKVKLQKLCILSYFDPDREKAFMDGFKTIRYGKLDGHEGKIVSFEECDTFIISETGLDHYVYSPDLTYEYDFSARAIYKKGVECYDYYSCYKKAKGYREKIQHKFKPNEDSNKYDKDFLEKSEYKNSLKEQIKEPASFGFVRSWMGIYHLSYKNSEYIFRPNIVSYPVGFGHGIGRADKVEKDEYLWRYVGNMGDSLVKKLAKKLQLSCKNLIPYEEDIDIRTTENDDGFIYQFIIKDKELYVRVNLPFIHKEDLINKPIPNTSMLEAFNIYYYRKVEYNKVTKHCEKNLPLENLSLPVCFDLKHNYTFLHSKELIDIAGKKAKRFEKKIWKDDKYLEKATSARTSLNNLLGSSATEFTRGFMRNPGSKNIWSIIKEDSEGLNTDQEWCHMQGHGDGGEDTAANLVSGSKHCNTEQLAIELGQRKTTHSSKSKKEYELRTTAYLLSKPDVKSKKKRRRSETDEVATEFVKNKKKDSFKNSQKPIAVKLGGTFLKGIPQGEEKNMVAAFLRYKIYREDVKIFDYTFEAQSEFFDKNMYRIINRLAEFTLKGNDAFEKWLDAD